MIQKLFSHVEQGRELLMQMMEVFSSSSTSRRFRSQSSLVDGEKCNTNILLLFGF